MQLQKQQLEKLRAERSARLSTTRQDATREKEQRRAEKADRKELRHNMERLANMRKTTPMKRRTEADKQAERAKALKLREERRKEQEAQQVLRTQNTEPSMSLVLSTAFHCFALLRSASYFFLHLQVITVQLFALAHSYPYYNCLSVIIVFLSHIFTHTTYFPT